MSLYPQTQAYGHMVYSAPQGYGHQPPPYYQQPPPPPQPYFADATYFGRDYTARLAELTVNSRPIIQNLSMIAQDYQRYADTVVSCIETHIRRAPPFAKLPAFYLLDAICKNVFEPYARLFTPVVVRLFLDTYELVDQSTRQKMDEMLLTWRTGAPNGRELFGTVPQLALERKIWGGESTQNGSSRGSNGISTPQVLTELDLVLHQKENLLQANPYDKQSQTHVAVLQQLKKLVVAGVSQDELAQILGQLRALAQPPQSAPPVHVPPVASVPPPVPQSYPQPVYHAPPPPSNQYPVAYPPQPTYPPHSYAPPKPAPLPIPPVESNVVPAQLAPSIPGVDVTSLYSALLKAGVVSTSASSTPTGAGATAKAEDSAHSTTPHEPAWNYQDEVLSAAIRLTSADIMKQRPPIVKFLYERLPNQCKQCGVRFPDDAAGKTRFQEHLDAHFIQNRKATQSAGRGYSRSWFIGIDDWLHDGTDVKGKGRADGPRLNAKAVAAAEAAKRDAELRSMFVVVPPGDEAKPISCPICKELLKSEFMEDDEEWVWRNAVKKDDRVSVITNKGTRAKRLIRRPQIYHATCHAEASAVKSNLVVRLKGEIAGRSRSRTPDVLRTPPRTSTTLEDGRSGSISPSKLVGTKRKAEDDERDGAGSEGLSTPPMKKLAVAAA
ncbi:hypothetical protein EIP86_004785 [Pleurotus ostreatoroseus]|nr:hypothetical protein EIP86_004785 [Pleurotus ostreatoroseus]